MALIDCPECGSRISNEAEKCPSCAYPINRKQTVTKSKEGFFLQSMNFGCLLILYGTIAVIILFIVISIFANS